MTENQQNVAMKDYMRTIQRNVLTRPEIIKKVSWIKKNDNEKSKNIWSADNFKRKTQ